MSAGDGSPPGLGSRGWGSPGFDSGGLGSRGLLEEILPKHVVAIETRQDLLDVELFPEERAVIENAVEKRRNEFTTARACARTALDALGLPAQPIPNGERGEPRWPAGVVGSITHCKGYRACAVALQSLIATLGIDAELNAPLPDGVLEAIAHPQELAWVGQLRRSSPEVHWDRLLFSAKESVYKAWFPLARQWLGFEDALITTSGEGAFSVKLLVEGPWLAEREEALTGFSGRWIVHDGLVLTAIALPQ